MMSIVVWTVPGGKVYVGEEVRVVRNGNGWHIVQLLALGTMDHPTSVVAQLLAEPAWVDADRDQYRSQKRAIKAAKRLLGLREWTVVWP